MPDQQFNWRLAVYELKPYAFPLADVRRALGRLHSNDAAMLASVARFVSISVGLCFVGLLLYAIL